MQLFDVLLTFLCLSWEEMFSTYTLYLFSFFQTACKMHAQAHTHTHTHTHTHMLVFVVYGDSLHRRNGFYTEQTVCAIALHLPYT